MKPKYLEHDNRGRDRWMVSYVDVLTILLIFFICAAMKPAKAPQPAASVAPPARLAPPTAPPTLPPAPLQEPALTDLQRQLEADGVEVRHEPRGVVVSLPQTILFASGDDTISQDARPVIAKIATAIRDLPNPVTLVGYADNIPVSNRRFHNNWELAAARGVRLLEMLTREYGIPESRLSVSSEGANRPKNSNETAQGRAGNRRVEIVIADET